MANRNPGPEWKPYFYSNENLIKPYYELNSEKKSADQFKFNCKHIENEFIWANVKQDN